MYPHRLFESLLHRVFYLAALSQQFSEMLTSHFDANYKNAKRLTLMRENASTDVLASAFTMM
jgi:hypothetical protein